MQEVGLYFSERTRDWYGREDETPANLKRIERMPTEKYYQAFLGVHSAMVESHIPCGILFDGNLSLDKLREFPVAYFPNAACITEKQADLLGEYVEGGGNLLATGLTGVESIGQIPLSRLVDHIEHAATVAGIDHVGLGSDFDAVGLKLPAGLEDIAKTPNLIKALKDRGFSDEDVDKVMGRNALRAMQAAEAAAA